MVFGSPTITTMRKNSSMENKRRASKVPGRSLSLAPAVDQNGRPNGRVDNRVVINVGGIRYETYKSTLKNLPDTRLSWITECSTHNTDYDPSTGEYFFDRHPGMFNTILNYYRTGRLHAPLDVCGPSFEEELAFWGIDEKQIEPCCWMSYRTHRDAEQMLAELDVSKEEEEQEEEDDNIAERFGIMEDDKPTKTRWHSLQGKMWQLLEVPYSSLGAQVLAIISIFFVLLSITIFALQTHIMFRMSINESMPIQSDWSVAEINKYTRPVPALKYIDYVCVGYFTLEFLVRIICCPNRKDFFRNTLNWVDLFSILPFFIHLLILLIHPVFGNPVARDFFNYIRLIRVFRIFKLTRHISGLKILGHTIKASAKEMLLLGLFLCISIIIFACSIYLAEMVDEGAINDFKSIPIGLWWACVTMTTLGYGDIYPRTMLGYIVGALCGVAGVLVLALPVPVIVNNFALYYSHAQARSKLPKKRKTVLVGAPDMLKTQIGMPGDSIAESGRVASPTVSDQGSAPSLREVSIDSNSVDSGIKRRSDESVNYSRVGISVIFTDESSSVLNTIYGQPEAAMDEHQGSSYPDTHQVLSNGEELSGVMPHDKETRNEAKSTTNGHTDPMNLSPQQVHRDWRTYKKKSSSRNGIKNSVLGTRRRSSILPHFGVGRVET